VAASEADTFEMTLGRLGPAAPFFACAIGSIIDWRVDEDDEEAVFVDRTPLTSIDETDRWVSCVGPADRC
jgi:hypothetical protein